MNEQPIVRLRGVSKHYGTTRALDDVSLDLKAGTIVGVLGPNGSGKTTLMAHLPGLLLPTTGTVETFGQPSAKLDDATLARIGYVSQEPRLMDWLTVGETIAFVRAGRPVWDDALAVRLLNDFTLDPAKRVSALSPGTAAAAGHPAGGGAAAGPADPGRAGRFARSGGPPRFPAAAHGADPGRGAHHPDLVARAERRREGRRHGVGHQRWPGALPPVAR